MSFELHFMSYELNFMSYEFHFMSYISDRRCKLPVASCGLQMGVQDAVADWGGGQVAGCGLQDAGCRMQMQVAYKYGSFLHLGKVKKIRNLECSCPGSD